MDTNWTALVLGILSPVSALGGVCLTLWFQERRELSGAGLDVAVELVASGRSFYFSISTAAKREAQADNWKQLEADRIWMELSEEAKVAGKRWGEARARADLSFSSKAIRSQIAAAADALSDFEQEYLKVGPTKSEGNIDDPAYVSARETAADELTKLRDLLSNTKAGRY